MDYIYLGFDLFEEGYGFKAVEYKSDRPIEEFVKTLECGFCEYQALSSHMIKPSNKLFVLEHYNKTCVVSSAHIRCAKCEGEKDVLINFPRLKKSLNLFKKEKPYSIYVYNGIHHWFRSRYSVREIMKMFPCACGNKGLIHDTSRYKTIGYNWLKCEKCDRTLTLVERWTI